MKKLIIYCAASILCFQYASGMEEKIEITEDKIEKNNESKSEELKPHRFVTIIGSVDDNHSIIINESDTTAIVRKESEDFTQTIQLYSLMTGEILNKFITRDYRYFGIPSRGNSGNMVFLIKGKKEKNDVIKTKIENKEEEIDPYDCRLNISFYTDESEPFFMYNAKDGTLKKLNYTIQEGDLLNGSMSGLSDNAHIYKIIRLQNSNKPTKILFFDKSNDLIHTISDDLLSRHMELSPSGNSLIIGFYKQLDQYINKLYNIEDKKNPQLLKTFISGYSWWSQLENIFCDSKSLFDFNGNELQKLTDNTNENVIGFSKNHFALNNTVKNTTTLYTRDGSKEPRIIERSWRPNRLDRICGINNEKEIILYDVFRMQSEKIAVYRSLKTQELDNNNSGSLPSCVIL